jgi:hypothetical protein
MYPLQSHVCLYVERKAERCDLFGVIWVQYSPRVAKGGGPMLSFRDHCLDCSSHTVEEVDDAANETILQLVMH